MPESGAELLARIKPTLREETAVLCLRPDLLDAHEEATEALARLQVENASKGQRLADKPSAEVTELAERVQSIEADIEANEARITLRAMPKDEWQALCDQHPPRKNDTGDAYAGYDRVAVIDAAVRECVVDPVFDDASWDDFTAVCNPSEWEELRRVARSVNRAVTESPKSVLASRILGKAGNGSRPPAPGE